MSRRLLVAVTKAIPSDAGQKTLLSHFSRADPQVQEAYSEMLEDMLAYRAILAENRIGEFQASQREKVATTAGRVGLQVPVLFRDPADADKEDQ